jgi:hypothetical protein
MTREAIIQKTMEVLSVLPTDKLEEVSDFADYILKKYDDRSLKGEMQAIVEESDTFYFLKDEEDLYSVEDLKERYK